MLARAGAEIDLNDSARRQLTAHRRQLAVLATFELEIKIDSPMRGV